MDQHLFELLKNLILRERKPRSFGLQVNEVEDYETSLSRPPEASALCVREISRKFSMVAECEFCRFIIASNLPLVMFL
jgi:hypothetical protein